MDPVHETRPRVQKEHALDLKALPNDIYELVEKVEKLTVINSDGGSEKRDALNSRSSIRTVRTVMSHDFEADPLDFFRELILDLIPDIVKTDNERITERYDNKLNPFNGKASIGDRLKSVNCSKFGEALSFLKI